MSGAVYESVPETGLLDYGAGSPIHFRGKRVRPGGLRRRLPGAIHDLDDSPLRRPRLAIRKHPRHVGKIPVRLRPPIAQDQVAGAQCPLARRRMRIGRGSPERHNGGKGQFGSAPGGKEAGGNEGSYVPLGHANFYGGEGLSHGLFGHLRGPAHASDFFGVLAYAQGDERFAAVRVRSLRQGFLQQAEFQYAHAPGFNPDALSVQPGGAGGLPKRLAPGRRVLSIRPGARGERQSAQFALFQLGKRHRRRAFLAKKRHHGAFAQMKIQPGQIPHGRAGNDRKRMQIAGG